MRKVRNLHTMECDLYPLRGVARARRQARIDILKVRFANQKIEDVFITNVQVKPSFSGDTSDQLIFTVLTEKGQKVDIPKLNLKLQAVLEAILKLMK